MKSVIERSRPARNLTVVSETLPGFKSVSLGLWIDRGSRDETPSTLGLSHLYEHMIFKGTESRSAEEIARVMEKSGGFLNAFTGKEQICLYTRFIAEELPTACHILRDIFRHPLLSREDLEKEKNVVLEEIHGYEDDPENLAHDQLMACLWPGEPLGAPITGTEKSVKALGRRALLSFCREAQSSRVVIAASGNVRHRDLLERFSGLCAAPSAGPSIRRRSPSRARSALVSRGGGYSGTGGERRLVTKDILQSNVALGFRICPYDSEDKYAFMIFNALIGEGMSSRLFQKLREEMGLVYSIYSFLEAYSDTGLFGVYLGTDADKTVPAIREVLKEIRRSLAGGLTEADLKFAKSFLRGNVLLSMESTVNRMMHLARAELYLGRVESVEKTLKRVEAVDLDELKRVCSKYLTPGSLSLSVIAPRGSVQARDLKKVDFTGG